MIEKQNSCEDANMVTLSHKIYQYNTLSSPDSIRIIRILQSDAYNKERQVEIKIEEVSLKSSPTYQALSYTWGENIFPCNILCDSQIISVTQNLYDALLNFRDSEAGLWIDALCINQQDDTEKSSQIPLMEEIYRKASSVLIWLGIETTESGTAMRYLEGIGEAFLMRGGVVSDPRTEQLDDANGATNKVLWEQVYHDPAMKTVNTVLDKSWFTRRWIIQELAFAKEAYVYCGSERIRWETFSKAASVLAKLDGDGTEVFNRRSGQLRGRSSLALQNIMKLGRVRDQLVTGKERNEVTMSGFLEDTRGFDCRDDKDRVFSVLGIFNYGRSDPFTISYEKSEAEVFEAFTRYCLSNETQLDLLSWAGTSNHASCGSILGLPSWVVDWRLPFRKPTDMLLGFNAARRFPSSIKLDTYTADLTVRGNLIDHVVAVAPHVGEFEESELAVGSPKWTVLEPRYIGLWYQIAELTLHAAYRAVALEYLEADRYVLGGSLSDALGRTLILNNNKVSFDFKRHPANVLPENVPEDYPQPILSDEYTAFRNFIFLKVGDVSKPPKQRDPDFGAPLMVMIDQELMEYFSRAVDCCQDRAFFITSRGMIGLGPKEVQVGDYASIIAGTGVLYIIRPFSDARLENPVTLDGADKVSPRFKMVGECYVHGVMQGEIWDGLDDTVMEEILLF